MQKLNLLVYVILNSAKPNRMVTIAGTKAEAEMICRKRGRGFYYRMYTI